MISTLYNNRKKFVEIVKNTGQYIIDNVDNIVPQNTEDLKDIDIWLNFSSDEMPDITVTTEFYNKKNVQLLENIFLED